MKRTTATVLVLVLALLGIVGAHVWFRWSPHGTVVRGPEYEGVLMGPLPGGRVADWKPTPVELQRMEAALTPFVESNPQLFNSSEAVNPRTYLRHYWGFERDGVRFIGVKFLRKGFVTRRQWLNGVIVSGGAAHNNWHITWCPETETFSGLSPFPIEKTNEDRQPSPGAYSSKAADGLTENAQE